MKYLLYIIIFCFLSIASAFAENIKFDNFSTAKKMLLNEVYYDHMETIYCKAVFDRAKKITLPVGFKTPKHHKRAERLEWEHAVPAENFGRSFEEWRNGHPNCIKSNGKKLSNRQCTEKTNRDFRLMESDMYNLYPAIGAVNAIRSNYNYREFSKDTPNTFGSCSMKILDNKAEPPDYAKGTIARTYLYFESEYPRYKMSDQTKKMMQAWDKLFPVDKWECTRAKMIEEIQGNPNAFVKSPCEEKGLYSL